MKYTINQFRKDFPTDDICLNYIFNKKYPTVKGYKITGRKDYADATGKQYSPLAGTIFEKSSTKLTSWFHAIYLFSVSKNGVSAKELERQLGVTYKTAWRMAKQIRSLMGSGNDLLSGTVEIDETYVGGRGRNNKRGRGAENKTPVFGMVERGGTVKAKVVPNVQIKTIQPIINDSVEKGTKVMTDEFNIYSRVAKNGYLHEKIEHAVKEYVRDMVHTNTIEGFWSQLKRGLLGTYNGAISSSYLQQYVDEFSFRYAQPSFEIFEKLMARI